MKVAIDAMGGDYAPEEIVKGAILGTREQGVGVILVGPEQLIARELANQGGCSSIEIVATNEYLQEGEHPAFALRTKRNASIAVATRLVKEGKADAVIGAGPTGGVVAAALQILGSMEGIARPVVGGNFLAFAPNTVLMDVGGNVDCRPDQLLDFAIVGAVYTRKVLGIENPTVALLSNGAEEGKGNEHVREAYALFKKSGLNFIGNVEGSDLPLGRANVIVCDGFVGNVLVKFCESLGRTVAGWLEAELEGKLPRNEVKELADKLVLATNQADASGGGPLWAVNGVAIVAHGRSKAVEIARAIAQAKAAVEMDLVGALRSELAAARSKVQ
ncbi:MAG: phosphate acyltransferase PlsX [Dehalococcoidia bacterium]|nr:phosphate acyltransferase PlsX [Dehalococcoidia bacterium]